MTCTELEELLGAYVLDAVTHEEKEAAETHLAQCPRCLQLVQEMRAVVDFLPLTVTQEEPRPQLKGRVLAAVQAVADASSQSTQNVATVRPLRASPSRMPEQQRPTSPIPLRRRSSAQRWAMPLVAAAAVLFLLLSGGLATWNISLQHQVAILQTNTVTTTTYAIKGTQNAPEATGEAKHIIGNGLDVTVVTLRGLPALQNQQVYQGWEIQGKQTKSVGLLNVQSDGTATINILGDIKGNDAVAVSVEKGPTATPDAPKGKVLAEGKIT
ncbi:MAG: hypothetical protein PVS3B3_27300 [Ktedonobacteraceae bacterium]